MLAPKVAFGGPSGSGKTTLANFVKEIDPQTRQIQSFETREFPEGVKQRWLAEYGYRGDIGHKALIDLQSEHPAFGVEWQRATLDCRSKVISENHHFVMDRSPLDNVVYMLTQVSHNMTEKQIYEFIEQAKLAYAELDVFVLVGVSDQPSVENNNSRVSNIYYQRFIHDVFQGVWSRYFQMVDGPMVLSLEEWNLPMRKTLLASFLGYNENTI